MREESMNKNVDTISYDFNAFVQQQLSDTVGLTQKNMKSHSRLYNHEPKWFSSLIPQCAITL